QAITEYRKLIEAYPRDPLAAKAQYGIGDALFNAGRSEEAIEAYTVVLERYPGSVYVSDAAAGIQYALAAVGDDDRAEAIINEFVERHPNSPIVDELRFRQAEVKYQSGRTTEALADLQRFVRSSGNEKLLPEAYYYLGSIFAERGDDEEAISYLRQVVDKYAGSARFAEAARSLGQIYLDAERPEDALAVYRKLESTSGGDSRLIAEARYGQGMALLRTDRTEEAERLLRNAVDAAPDSPETLPAYLGLARVYEGSGREGDAIRLYGQVVEKSRDEIGAEALYRLGALLLERGDARRAVEELARMPVLYTGYTEWVARGYLAQARAFRELGQNGEAARVYDRIISEFGGTSYASTAVQEKEAL
ncbi:MAG: tetratricopeptide repeat protein, partial [Rhodothermales bacterium]